MDVCVVSDLQVVVAAVVVLLTWTRLARGISDEDASEKLISCQQKCIKTFEECAKELPHMWKMCHDLYVWAYNYCKLMFFNRIRT